MNEETLLRYSQYRDDPWLFLTECCFTQDAVDLENPVKLYPNYPYLKFMVRLWQRTKLLLIPKSRRMTQSWTFLALILWDVIFHKNRTWAVVSKKEDDSMELVHRIEFMFSRIPPDKIPAALLPSIKGGRMLKSPPKIEFDFGNGETSYVSGFPMGADQLRQFTFSGILGDEAAFWPDAEEFYTGSRPTILGGGRMILISSRSPGFFKRLVFDRLNAKSDTFAETPPVPPKSPMQGVEVWVNPENEFTVVDLHYSAHPDRRSESYKEALKRSLPLHQYLREYERNWQTFAGLPVYPNFRRDIHVHKGTIHPRLGLPILFGWDFGLTPACVAAQKVGNRLLIMKEWVSQNEPIDTFAKSVMSDVFQLWPGWSKEQHYHFIDPAGFQRAQTDARTCAQVMQEVAAIVNLEPGPVDFTTRKGAVEKFLIGIDKDGAWLQVDETECPSIYVGFTGGYKYNDSQSDIEAVKPTPVKNKYSHPHDALQYVAYGATSILPESLIDLEIKTPQYGFTHPELQPTRKINYGSY